MERDLVEAGESVSILVFLDSLLQTGAVCDDGVLGGCFNPCFSGFTSTTVRSIQMHRRGDGCFNPCFSGFTSTPLRTFPSLLLLTKVSILVFLDSLLQLVLFLVAIVIAIGFNPCFSGFTSTTYRSKLFWSSVMPFQSLFFWIHFYNHRLTACCRRCKYVSILVFLDSLLQPGRYMHMFGAMECFNPCFSGFTSTTMGCWVSSQILAQFQSLFFWIHFYNAPPSSGRRHSRKTFQSLFFLDSLLQPRDQVQKSAYPIVSILVFLDSLLQQYTQTIEALGLGRVSILVFLDSLLQPSMSITSTAARHCFNPCFSGFTSTTGDTRRRGKPKGRVSILVFLDSLLQPLA